MPLSDMQLAAGTGSNPFGYDVVHRIYGVVGNKFRTYQDAKHEQNQWGPGDTRIVPRKTPSGYPEPV